jgi:hypothetical protein
LPERSILVLVNEPNNSIAAVATTLMNLELPFEAAIEGQRQLHSKQCADTPLTAGKMERERKV